jgi:sulfur-carrier protein
VPVTVVVPGYLQSFTGGRESIAVDAAGTVADVLRALELEFPGVVSRVVDEQREIRTHINLFVDGENVKELQGLAVPVREGSELLIVPAVSGG